jgi:tetratricopeptide (TPR) repeat protein
MALVDLRAQISVCKVTGPKAGVPSLATALAVAHGLLSGHVPGGKLAGLISGATLTNAEVNEFSLAGLAKGQPGVALLSFLAAHHRDPSDPLPLLDAAVMLSGLGHQADAVALLAGAGRLADRAVAPLGISVQALIDNARGVARFRQGEFSAAQAQFRAALALAPGLAPAERNLAASFLCRGRAQNAVTPYRRSIYVDSVQSQPASATTGGETPPIPSDALDLSHGIPGTLPALTIPATADDAVASNSDLQADATNAGNGVDQAAQQGEQDIAQLSAEQARLGFRGAALLTIKRQDEVLDFWNKWQTSQPDLEALYEKVQADYAQMEPNSPSLALGQQIEGIQEMCSQQPNTTQCLQQECWPAVQEGHAEWVPGIQSYDSDVRAFAAALYRFATAVASNVASPAEGAAITTSAREEMLKDYAGELDVISAMTSNESDWADECDNPDAPGTAAGDNGMTDTPEAPPCPPGLSAVKFSLKLGFGFELEVSCEEIELQVSDGPVSPFAKVGYKFDDGSMSAYIGAKAGFEVDDDVQLSVKGGMYINWDAQGNMTDVGLRVDGPSLGGEWEDLGLGAKTGAVGSVKVSLAPELL